MKHASRIVFGPVASFLRPLLAGLFAAAMLATGFPGEAQARASLREDRQIEDGLTLVAIGNYLRRECEDIAPKYFKTLNFMRTLQDRARQLGYSDAEIEAYLDDKREKERVKAKARAYLEARGAVFGQPETFCSVGRAEIAAQTPVGSFLTAR